MIDINNTIAGIDSLCNSKNIPSINSSTNFLFIFLIALLYLKKPIFFILSKIFKNSKIFQSILDFLTKKRHDELEEKRMAYESKKDLDAFFQNNITHHMEKIEDAINNQKREINDTVNILIHYKEYLDGLNNNMLMMSANYDHDAKETNDKFEKLNKTMEFIRESITDIFKALDVNKDQNGKLKHTVLDAINEKTTQLIIQQHEILGLSSLYNYYKNKMDEYLNDEFSNAEQHKKELACVFGKSIVILLNEIAHISASGLSIGFDDVIIDQKLRNFIMEIKIKYKFNRHINGNNDSGDINRLKDLEIDFINDVRKEINAIDSNDKSSKKYESLFLVLKSYLNKAVNVL